MARKPLTEAQKKARVAKAKATREANKQKALQALGLDAPRKKLRKPRVMTEEQKQAARERLAKARANRGPSTNKLIAENVRNLPDENVLSLKSVRGWIKENKEQLVSMRALKDSKDWKERSKYKAIETYVANLEAYLRDGVYRDLFYGSQMQHRIKYVVTTMAYNDDGTPKRMVGHHYPDIGVYTKEMADEDNGR